MPPEEDPTPEEAAPAEEQVDLSTLPAPVQSYIKELREEARDRRKEHEPFKEVFAQYNEREREFLLDMVNNLGQNQAVGAKQMLQFAQNLLGVETEEKPPVAEEEDTEEPAAPAAVPAGITKDEVAQLLKEQAEQQKLVDQVHKETRDLGFEPGTKEAKQLWDLAITLQEADLSKVAPLVHQFNGTSPAAEETEEEEPEEEPTPEFPKPAGRGGSGGTNEPAEPVEPPQIKSDQMRERVLRRISQQVGA